MCAQALLFLPPPPPHTHMPCSHNHTHHRHMPVLQGLSPLWRCAQAPCAACGGSRRRWCRHTHRCRRRWHTPHVPPPCRWPLQSPLLLHEPPRLPTATAAACFDFGNCGGVRRPPCCKFSVVETAPLLHCILPPLLHGPQPPLLQGPHAPCCRGHSPPAAGATCPLLTCCRARMGAMCPLPQGLQAPCWHGPKGCLGLWGANIWAATEGV